MDATLSVFNSQQRILPCPEGINLSCLGLQGTTAALAPPALTGNVTFYYLPCAGWGAANRYSPYCRREKKKKKKKNQKPYKMRDSRSQRKHWVEQGGYVIEHSLHEQLQHVVLLQTMLRRLAL